MNAKNLRKGTFPEATEVQYHNSDLINDVGQSVFNSRLSCILVCALHFGALEKLDDFDLGCMRPTGGRRMTLKLDLGSGLNWAICRARRFT